jgi:hypothetical protein
MIQIEKLNKTEVQAGDWALISMLPFESQETLTVTMKDQEVFMVRVTDAAYDGTVITNLNGATGALVNTTNQNAVQDTAQNGATLRAIQANVSGSQVTTPDGSPELTQWTFNYVGNWNGNNYYTIRTGSG